MAKDVAGPGDTWRVESDRPAYPSQVWAEDRKPSTPEEAPGVGEVVTLRGTPYIVAARMRIGDLADWKKSRGYRVAWGEPWPRVSYRGSVVLIVEREV